MTDTPAEVFARRMRSYRENRVWSQADLARELSQIGWKVDRAQVARIESGDRGIALNEAIMIAWVLAIPPALLYLPLGEAANIALAPEVIVHPDAARTWVTGVGPAATSDQFARMPGEWKTDMVVWWLHDRLGEQFSKANQTQTRIRSAEYVGEGISEAKQDHVDALRELVDLLNDMRERGLVVPEIQETMSDELKALEIKYDGPTYPDPKE